MNGSSAVVRYGGWYYLGGWLQSLIVLQYSEEAVTNWGLTAESGSYAVVRNGGWYYLEGWLQRLVVLQW